MYYEMENIEEVLCELNLSSLTPYKISKTKIRVDRPTIFLTFTDTNLRIQDYLYDAGFILSTCQGLISPSKIIKINNKPYNGKLRFLDLKRTFLAMDATGGRKIKVYTTLSKDAVDSSRKDLYWFYDLGIYSDAIKFQIERFAPKIVAQNFIYELGKVYQKLKSDFPSITIDVLFLGNNANGYLYDLLSKIRVLLPERDLNESQFFDRFVLGSDGMETIMPLIFKDNKDTKLSLANINRYLNILETNSKNQETPAAVSDNDTSLTTPNAVKQVENEQSKIDKNSIFSKIVDSLRTSNLHNSIKEDGSVQTGVNTEDLSRTLKKYKINDPDIVANVKSSLDFYIKDREASPSKEEAELVVLKAINYTIHGKDVIDDEYLVNPNKLIKKLGEMRTHKTALEFPENPDDLINPTTIIDIDYTTGAWRQKYEFEKTIHKNIQMLFKTLETVSNFPIKVLDIQSEVKEDDQNRYINYQVKLQNTLGGVKDPYTVELNVPAPVNDRYFRLHNSQYIMASQQFFKPVTKTEKAEVRVLSNYAIVRLQLQNLKFTPSDVDELFQYIQTKYPSLIKEVDEGTYTFNDGSTIYTVGTNVYDGPDGQIKTDVDTGKLIDSDGNNIPAGRIEYIYELLKNKISSLNPSDNLTKTKKSIPFVQLYIGSYKVPLVLYLWQLQGLLKTLNDFDIQYAISDDPHKSGISVNMGNNQYLNVYPKTFRQQLIANGILSLKLKEPIEDLNNPELIYPYIDNIYGTGAVLMFRTITQYILDAVTKQMLSFENLPQSLPNLLSTYCMDVLLNKKPDSLSDLKIYRARMSEIILNIMYKQLAMAHNQYYKKVVDFGDQNAQLALAPDFIINDIISGSGILQHTEAVNPVDEIALASRTIKTGPGGVPSQRMFKPSHRNIHPSHYGIMSAVTTPEHSAVGLVVSHTLVPAIINELGSYGIKDLSTMKKFGALSINEALTPFQHQMDSDRLLMATAHAKQITPTNGNEPPLVGTGAEYIVPQLSSTRFVHRAKKDGIITELNPGKTMTVKYNDGSIETLDILPRLSKTKMSAYISLDIDTLGIGTKFKKNQVLAFTKNFNTDGIFCSGRNVCMAMMNYDGMNHEDAYVISEELSKTLNRDIVKEVSIIIPPETKVLNLETEIGKVITVSDTLVEFTYHQDLDQYLELNNILDDIDGEEVLNMYSSGQGTIKAMGRQGVISDIKVYINNKNSVDKQVNALHKSLVKDTQDIINKLTQHSSTKDELLKASDNLNLKFIQTGGHKDRGVEFTGAKIVYYIKSQIPLNVGDKIATRFGAKGVLGQIIKNDDTPYTESTKTPIDVFISPLSVFSRKNISMVKELYLGKIIYHLNKQAREKAENSKISNDQIIKFIKDVYGLIGDKSVVESVATKLNNISPGKFRNLLKNGLTMRIVVPPFTDVSFENIKSAADFLNIPLDEKVYIPAMKCWTKEPVPVGISYIQVLEQLSEIYANIRSAGKYQGLTGQATKGKIAPTIIIIVENSVNCWDILIL